MDIKVSVIVPVYNGEMYLRQCMDSICNQTLREIEIICVDDGSTDSSYDILMEYAAKDERIIIYRQENRYAGAARNLGKSHAKGEYLVFWDCDDFFALNALEELYNKASDVDADVCVCGANQYVNNKEQMVSSCVQYMNSKYLPVEDVFSINTLEDYILNFTTAAPWNKMFRRSFIEQIKLDFKEIRTGNDVYFVVNSLCQAERITTVRKALVTYRMNQEGNLTGTMSKSPLAPIETWSQTAENLIAVHRFPERSFINRALDNMIYLLRNINEWESFVLATKVLQESGLARMHLIEEREDSYYYSPLYAEAIGHLRADAPEDLLIFLAHRSYFSMRQNNVDKLIANEMRKKSARKAKKLSANVQKLNEELEIKKEELDRSNEELKKSNEDLMSVNERLRIANDNLKKVNEELEKSRVKIESLDEENKAQREELSEIKDSAAFRISCAISFLPRKIKSCCSLHE